MLTFALDDQLVPIDDSVRLSAKIVKDATLKVYPAAPHGMCSPPKDELNADLLPFISDRAVSGDYNPVVAQANHSL